MIYRFAFILIPVLALASLSLAQRADFKPYGNGCPGSTQQTCPSNNPKAATIDRKITSSNPQLAIQVQAVTPVITGFELFTQSTVKRTIKAWILVADASGLPSTTPFATGSITVDTKAGWYRATFPKLVVLGARKKYFISWEPGPNLTRLIFQPRAKLGTTSVHYEYKFFFGKFQWFGPFNTERWAWKIVCPGGSRSVPTLAATGFPTLGNSTFSVDLLGGKANSAALIALGSSKTSWVKIPLPLDMGPAGAPGCSLLSSVDLLIGMATTATGSATLPLPIPNDSRFTGLVFHSQWIVLDKLANKFGLTFSNGGTVSVGR